MYSATFPHLSERFFKGVTWPPVEAVLHLVDGDHVFGLLYKEMYYRRVGDLGGDWTRGGQCSVGGTCGRTSR